MTWESRIGGCFGDQDCIFAAHPSDAERAKDLIKEAKSAGASKDDFKKEMVWHIYKKVTAPGLLDTFIKEQMKTFDKLWR